MKKAILTVLALAVTAASCIRNDIPYPDAQASIASLDVEGALKVSIDGDAREAVVTLAEDSDISNVRINAISFSDPAVTPSVDVVGVHDLSKPLGLTLSAYGNDWLWAIRAEQPIERYFTLSGQIGETVLDAPNKRIIIQVRSNIYRLNVTSFKLGPAEGTTYTPAVESLHDFSREVQLTVSYRGVSEVWTIFVEEIEAGVILSEPDVWTGVAWLKATGVEGRANGFRIRKAGQSEWTEVENVTSEGGTFSAMADGLSPLTEYECEAYSGDETASCTFTTEGEQQLPNSGFETFSNAESSKYYSFYDPSSPETSLQTKWWGSGNKGSTTVGASYAITKPDGEDKVEGNYSLRMESQYVIIKFAAGNIFSGEYGGNVGVSGGKVRMGRPFTLRPRKLTLWLKYKCGQIQQKTLGDYPEDDPVKVGDNDRGAVWVALGDWDYKTYGGTEESPVEVNTTKRETFFDPAGENVIAYGKFVTDQSMDWTKVEIPLEYVSTSRKPTHIIVSCAASMLGDYFTGSPDSILWVDDLKLED